MKDYHYAWLSAHPRRSAEWLQAKLDEGFDIHHLDWDHSNNDPGNLVLIETLDHMRIHDRPQMRFIKDARAIVRSERRKRLPSKFGAAAYDMKCAARSWRSIGQELFPDHLHPEAAARNHAKRHAKIRNLPFPKPGAHSEWKR